MFLGLKKYFSSLMLFAFSLCLSLALSEGIIASLSPNSLFAELDAMMHVKSWFYFNRHHSDKVFGYVSVPNTSFDFTTSEWNTHVDINSHGFRGPEFVNPDERESIFMVGDSFVKAPQLPYEKITASILQKLLADKGYQYTVNNLGVESYSTVQYYNLLRVYGEKWRPKIAVMLLWGNDIPRDNDIEDKTIVTRDGSGVIIELGLDTTYDNWQRPAWYEKFYLFWIVKHSIKQIKGFIKNDFKKKLADPPYWGMMEPENKDYFDNTLRYILATKELCDRLGIALVVSAIPFGDQVGKNQIGVGYHTTGSSHLSFQPKTQYPELIREYAQKNGVIWLDLLKEFRELAVRGEKLYFTWDGHLNEQGNMRLAEVVYRGMVDNALVKKQ